MNIYTVQLFGTVVGIKLKFILRDGSGARKTIPDNNIILFLIRLSGGIAGRAHTQIEAHVSHRLDSPAFNTAGSLVFVIAHSSYR